MFNTLVHLMSLSALRTKDFNFHLLLGLHKSWRLPRVCLTRCNIFTRNSLGIHIPCKTFRRKVDFLQVDQNTQISKSVYIWFGQQMAHLSWGGYHSKVSESQSPGFWDFRAQLKLHLPAASLCGSLSAKQTTEHYTTVHSSLFQFPSYLKV